MARGPRTDGYAYQWRQCDSAGNSSRTSPAHQPDLRPGAGDVGHTLRVQETASNSGGSSEPATSGASAVVLATFGKTGVGANTDYGMFANYKIVHHHAVGCGVDQQAELVCDTRPSTRRAPRRSRP